MQGLSHARRNIAATSDSHLLTAWRSPYPAPCRVSSGNAWLEVAQRLCSNRVGCLSIKGGKGEVVVIDGGTSGDNLLPHKKSQADIKEIKGEIPFTEAGIKGYLT